MYSFPDNFTPIQRKIQHSSFLTIDQNSLLAIETLLFSYWIMQVDNLFTCILLDNV